MKVTILQLDIEWGSPTVNMQRAEALMASAPLSDLYVLPEMWNTGFATEPTDIAEDASSSPSLRWMQEMAQKYRCALSGSIPVVLPSDASSAGPVYRNRHFFVNGRNGVVQYYDKHHLFSYGGEDRFYQSGEAHQVVEYEGIRFLLLTCYDLRFPCWCRYSDSLAFDAIIVVANWPESRQNAWQILTRARAIENQAYLIACNRVGDDPYSHYRGQSAVLNPIGKTIARCQPNVQQTVTAQLDMEYLQRQRTKFKVLEDRDFR